jgi:tetratricopeptide (TPR) repeat protein
MDFNLGLKLYQEGKFDEALEIFNKLIVQKFGKVEYHLYRGRILTRLRKNEQALADFDLLVSLEPYNTDFISDRGVVLHLMGRNEEALSELDRAVNLDPKNPYRYSSRAFLKDRIGDFLGSIEDYEKAIELDPEDAVSFNNKGLVEEKLGYKQRATQSFEKADNLVGYTPNKKAENIPSPKEKETPQASNSKTESSVKAEKLTAVHFWATMTALVKDSNARKEFKRFLKQIFARGTSKNA